MKLIFSVLVTFLTVAVHCEEKPKPFLSRILRHKGSVLLFNFQHSINDIPVYKINDLHVTFDYTGQGITKNSKGLFLHHIGTGRVYKWRGDAQAGEWIRIDSTFFTGYNFLSLFFSKDSSLYSYGGVGFLQQNGHLRKYNFSANEWKALQLSKSIPWLRKSREIFFVDTTKAVLYFNGQGRFHDALMNDNKLDSSTFDKLYMIDLEKGEVKELGNYQSEKGGFFGQTPWGTITDFYKLADFRNNQYYSLSEMVQNNLFRILAKSSSNHYNWQYTFWLDSALYFTNSKFDYDSVVIHSSDLIKTNIPLYTPIEVKTNQKPFSNNLLLIIVSILVGGINIFLILKYLKQKRAIQNTSTDQLMYESNVLQNNRIKLSEIETNLLRVIFENSVLKKMTEIAEINNTLGCGNKNIDVQKRLRSDAINALNEKLSLSFLTDHKIVERKRSAFDGRSFEYYIDQQYFNAIQQLLNNSTSS